MLDGQDTAPGVRVEGAGSSLQADDVTLQRLRLRMSNGAALIAFNAAQVSINGSDLLDNACDNAGGALELSECGRDARGRL